MSRNPLIGFRRLTNYLPMREQVQFTCGSEQTRAV